MKELNKVPQIDSCDKRHKAANAFNKQIKMWGLVMPQSELLVCDFGLGDFEHIGLIECWIANEIQKGYCGKFMFLFDNQTCPAHHHIKKHETFYIVKGHTRMYCNNKTFELHPGDTFSVTTNHIHSFTGIGPALILEISQPCFVNDNCFVSPQININYGIR